MSAKWTWLVYMAGDNNLQGAGNDDLAEMKKVGSTADVNVIVQFDTEQNKTTRYLVQKNKLKTLQTMPGVDSGDPKVLSDFIKWGTKNFPAQRYLVDVWNHGGGWENLPSDFSYDSIRAAKPQTGAQLKRVKRAIFRTTVKKIAKLPADARAIAIDCGSHDYLDNQELRDAVLKALPGGRKIDILGCDACLMNMLEIAYEMKNTANIMVGSEQTEPGAGWPYTAILKPLVAKPSMAAGDLAKLIVNEYGKYFQKEGEAATQSALDLSRIENTATAVNDLANELINDLQNVAGAVTLARDKAQKYEYPEYVDLGDFAKQLQLRLPANTKIKSAADKVLSSLGSVVIKNATAGKSVERSTGLSIYFPHQEDYAPDYSDLNFSKQGKWRKFLEALFKL
jgi:Clostripain family